MAVDIESLGGPKQQHGEEVGTGDEGDDQSEGKDARRLLQAGREHGIWCKFGFPSNEGHEQEEANKEGCKGMS